MQTLLEFTGTQRLLYISLEQQLPCRSRTTYSPNILLYAVAVSLTPSDSPTNVRDA